MHQRIDARLQRMESRYENWGVGELMRMAVEGDPAEETVVTLCRLLFRTSSGQNIRPPVRGVPGCIGGTEREDWPLLPVHLFEGIPFGVVDNWTIAGLAEPATWYLGYCLGHGVWNPDPYPDVGDDDLLAIAGRFVDHGPWRRPLEQWERDFVFSQVERAAEPDVAPARRPASG